MPLGDRKYLFIDDAIVAKSENVTFTVNPPRFAESVLDDVAVISLSGRTTPA